MLAASRPSKLPVHEPLLGGEVKKPILVVPPGQVLKGLFPAHQTCTGAGATQVPVGGAPLQLFCAKETTLPTESSIGSSPYVIRTFIFKITPLKITQQPEHYIDSSRRTANSNASPLPFP